MRDTLGLRHNVILRIIGPDGRVKSEESGHNTICTVGKRKLLEVSSPKSVKDFNNVAIGSGGTAEGASDTGLQHELARDAAEVTNPTPDITQFTLTIAAGVGTGTITESCLSLQAYTGDSGSVSARTADDDFTVGGNSHATGTYNGGSVTFTSGANSGLRGAILTHTLVSGSARLQLSAPMPNLVTVGDNVELRAPEDTPTILARKTFTGQVKGAGDAAAIVWQVS